jgi:hypothetical protein
MKELGQAWTYIERQKKPLFRVHKDILKPYRLQKLLKLEEHNGTDGPTVLLWKGDTMNEDFSVEYDLLLPGGMVFLYDANPEKIFQWRMENSHTPLVHTLEDNIWFWYKPTDDMNFVDEDISNQIAEAQKRTYERIPEPTPDSCHITVDMLKKYGRGEVFIETGTYFGLGIKVAVASEIFKEIYSIELDGDLAERAAIMFDRDAVVYCGDSPKMIEEISNGMPEDDPKPLATFWLDAHASGPLPGGEDGGTPVLQELRAIKEHYDPNSTIIIDDRRLFGSAEWNGVREEQALTILKEINPNFTYETVDGEVENAILVAYVK